MKSAAESTEKPPNDEEASSLREERKFAGLVPLALVFGIRLCSLKSANLLPQILPVGNAKTP